MVADAVPNRRGGGAVAVAAAATAAVQIAKGGPAEQQQLGVRALAVRLVALTAVWYASTIGATIVNKQLMDGFGHPTLLSFLHVSSGCVMDYFFLRSRGIPVPVSRGLLLRGVPVAVTLAGGKVLTYFSYGRVPASLTHTVKASSPVFSVLLGFAGFSQLPGLCAGLALLPITLGVAAAAVSEVDFQLAGFVAALTATMLSVLQSLYTKRTLQKLRVEPVAFHMYQCIAAQLLLLPWILTHDVLDIVQAEADALAAVPAGMLLASVALHYTQNLAAIYVLSHVNVITYQVMGTLKRLVTIVGSVLFFRNVVTMHNAAGMAVALAGFLAYGVARAKQLPADAVARRKRREDGGGAQIVPAKLAAGGGVSEVRVVVEQVARPGKNA